MDKRLIVIVSVIGALLLAATGIGFGLLHSSNVRLVDAQSNLADTQATLTETELNWDSTKTALTNTQDELSSVQTKLADTQSDLDGIRDELSQTQSNLVDVQTQLGDTESVLSAIQKVYPPTYFATYDDLEAWVGAHTPVSYSDYDLFDKALTLQAQALADGYILMAFYDQDATVINEAVVGDDVYWIWLDGDIAWVGSN